MLIKIVNGMYGYRPDPDENYIERKDSNSGPFEVDDKEAERLILLGIAQAVAQVGHLPSKDAEDEGDGLEDRPISELRKMAKELGLPADGSKAVLAEKIRHATAPASEDDDDGEIPQYAEDGENEAPPVLNAADPEV